MTVCGWATGAALEAILGVTGARLTGLARAGICGFRDDMAWTSLSGGILADAAAFSCGIGGRGRRVVDGATLRSRARSGVRDGGGGAAKRSTRGARVRIVADSFFLIVFRGSWAFSAAPVLD